MDPAAQLAHPRAETIVQIRKENADDHIKRRTLMPAADAASIMADMDPGGSNITILIQKNNEMVMFGDPELQLQAIQLFRSLLSIQYNPPIDQVIKAGVVQYLVQFLQMGDNPVLQHEAAWVLTSIASGTSEQTRNVIEAGAVPLFVRLLSSGSEDVRQQAACALANVAGDSKKCRDLVLQCGALPALLRVSETFSEESSYRSMAWALSNLCRGKPAPDLKVLRPALPLLARLLSFHDIETVVDACWALSYISNGPDSRIQAVLDTGVVPKLVELLGSPSTAIQASALRNIGNVVSGNDIQTQVIIDHNVLPALQLLLDSPKQNICKEVCWTISNITAGPPQQIQAVIDANIFPKLISLLASSVLDIQREAAWAVSNVTCAGSYDQIMYLVQQGAIPPMCHLLTVPDRKVVVIVLNGLDSMLRKAKAANRISEMVYKVMECDGVAAIKELQNHSCKDLCWRAKMLLAANYFRDEKESASGRAGGMS